MHSKKNFVFLYNQEFLYYMFKHHCDYFHCYFFFALFQYLVNFLMNFSLICEISYKFSVIHFIFLVIDLSRDLI